MKVLEQVGSYVVDDVLTNLRHYKASYAAQNRTDYDCKQRKHRKLDKKLHISVWHCFVDSYLKEFWGKKSKDRCKRRHCKYKKHHKAVRLYVNKRAL